MEEKVDVVDRNDKKVGTATRWEVHRSGAWHRGIHILVFDPGGQMLLQRRSAKKATSPGALDLSVSEHAKAGESFEEAAFRGLREELGIGRIPLTWVLKFRMAYAPEDNMISTIYRATFDGKFKLDPAEVEEVVPFDRPMLRELVDDQDSEVAPWARQILRWYLKLPTAVEEVK